MKTINSFSQVYVTGQTPSRIASIDANNSVISLDTATYPSLAELAYVKGLNQSIATTSTPSFGALTVTNASGAVVTITSTSGGNAVANLILNSRGTEYAYIRFSNQSVTTWDVGSASSAGVLDFREDGSTSRMSIAVGGAISLNTSSGNPLGITTTSNTGISMTDATVTGIVYMSTTMTNSFAIGTTSNHPLIFGTNNVFTNMYLDTSGVLQTAKQVITQVATTGYGFYVNRNLDAASTDSPLIYCLNDSSTDNQATAWFDNDGTGQAVVARSNNTSVRQVMTVIGNVASDTVGLRISNTASANVGQGTRIAFSNDVGASGFDPTNGAIESQIINAGNGTSNLIFSCFNGSSEVVVMTLTGAVAGCVLGNSALATTAVEGFLYIASCAGTPTGVPTSYTGRTPMVYDTTNNKFYIYNGAWKSVTLA